MDFQAFLITFREALEALLIVGVIVTYLTRIGETRWNKWVWLGVVLALLSSYGVALAFQVVFTGFSQMANHIYLTIGILFISTVLLTHMIMFMSKQGRDMKGEVQGKVAAILTTGSVVNMIVHSYLITLREGVETVFFFAAISQGNIEKAITSWGALIGLLTAIVIAWSFFRGTRRVPLGTFFKITGIFLVIIAAGLFVQGVSMAQDVGILGSLYRTDGGEIGELYNITWFMPEHPQDYEHYVRDFGETPLISGQVGVFMKAFLGYTQNPSVEEFLAYWGYYFVVMFLLIWQRKKTERFVQTKTNAENVLA
ncbi:FTR1 family iron permease [Paenibacillus thermotolerans]|uniref:FTR1 family iron permease n=1 Tax=Paenibacillus thermotolerans TaxID=3027807 RepID=UPI002367A451|nr:MULTISPECIES: FTR1 family protein [unclassified Paenibacillus]